MINSFRDIIDLWGAPRILAGEIGAKPNTVSKWGQRDFIPPEWWEPVQVAARKRDLGSVTIETMARIAATRREESDAVA